MNEIGEREEPRRSRIRERSPMAESDRRQRELVRPGDPAGELSRQGSLGVFRVKEQETDAERPSRVEPCRIYASAPNGRRGFFEIGREI